MATEKKKGGLGRVLKLFGLGLLLLVLVFVGFGLTLDSEVQIERSVTINADARKVHAWVGDLKKWDEWGPWREEDPNMTYTYSDTTTEVGSRMDWKMEQGSGAVWFTAVDRDTGVKYKFQWENWAPTDGGLRYEKQPDGGTKVTWHFEADMGWNLPGRYMMRLGRGNIEDMFDKGLANLKAKVEG